MANAKNFKKIKKMALNLNHETLITNLRTTAREAFRLYPEIYHIDQPTDEKQLKSLAHAYGIDDGFYDAGLRPEECEEAVLAEWREWVEEQTA